MRCSSCGNDNREGRKFCVQCGQPLSLVCPSCGAPAEPGERLCGDCGGGLVAADAQPASFRSPAASASDNRIPTEQAEAALEGERKTVTALFADIKESTELERDLDPEEARTMLVEICNWSTKGFETADLKEVKALLDELSVKGGEC